MYLAKPPWYLHLQSGSQLFVLWQVIFNYSLKKEENDGEGCKREEKRETIEREGEREREIDTRDRETRDETRRDARKTRDERKEVTNLDQLLHKSSLP